MAEQDRVSEAFIALARGASPEAEAYLANCMKEECGGFFTKLSELAADDTKPIEVRSRAAMYIKNQLYGTSAAVQKEKHDRWKTLDGSVRGPIKDNLMQALRNANNPEMPQFAALAAAEIAAVELPYNEWGNFLGLLQENVTNPQCHEKVKVASLQCLGYVCDRIVDVEDMLGSLPELEASTINSVLTTIAAATGEGHPHNVRKAALQALKNSLLFIKKNMDVKDERDFIIKAMLAGCTNSDSSFRELAFSCIDSVIECYYDYISEYMTAIFECSTAAITNANENDEVKGAAIEIWNTLAETEAALLEEERESQASGIPLDRPPCPKYVAAALDLYVPMMLGLLTQQEEDDDNDESHMQEKAAVCLELISLTVEGQIIPRVVPYIEQNIQSPEWRNRDAAIVAFMAILEGPSTAEMGQYVAQSIPVMLENFNHEHVIVRGSAVHCVRKIAANHLSALSKEQIQQVLNAVDGKLEDRASIAAASCSTIYEICLNLKEVPPPPTNILSSGIVKLIQDLLKVTERSDANEYNLSVVAMSAAANVITASAKDVQDVFSQLLPVIAERLENALQQHQEGTMDSNDKESQAQMIGQLTALVQTLYQRMEKSAVLPLSDRIMNILLRAVHVRSAQEEAFMAIGAVISNLEEDFMKYFDAFIPLLLQGLHQLELTELVTICAGNVVELCGGVGEKIGPHANAIMEALFEIVRNSAVHRDVKPAVISCFGDVAMAIGSSFQQYLQLTCMLLMQASQQQAPPDNDDMISFINQLRCAVLEAYSGILVGLADGGALGQFQNCLPNIMLFCAQLANDPAKDEVVLQKAVTLLGDIAHEFGATAEVKAQLNQPFVGILLTEAVAIPNPSAHADVQWATTQVESLLKAPPVPAS